MKKIILRSSSTKPGVDEDQVFQSTQLQFFLYLAAPLLDFI